MFPLLTLLALVNPAASPPASPPLTQTTWTLIQIKPGHELYTLPERLQKPTLRITGAFAGGFTGCSLLTAKVSVQGQNIRFSGVDSGPSDHCPDHIIDLRDDYAGLLENAQTYQITGDRLTIRAGAGLLIFAAARREAVTSTPKSSALLNKTFDLVSINGKVVPGKHGPIRLNFTENRISGSDGCNGFAGKYRLLGTELLIPDSLVGTQMGCIWMAKIPNLQVFLQQLPRLSLTGRTLRLETAQDYWVFETH